MRVLQLGKFYPPHFGGIESVMEDLADGLQSRGITCDVLCSNKSSRSLVETTALGSKIYRSASLGILAKTSISPQMIYMLKKLSSNYDLIHAHFPDPMAALCILLALPKRKKLVIHWHSDIIKQKYLLKAFLPLQNYSLRRADAIIATSQNYVDSSTQLVNFKNKCHTIPLGIEDSSQHTSILKSSIKPNSLLFVGRLSSNKGVEFAIHAIKELPSFNLYIVGDGEERTRLTKLADDRIHFLGHKSRKELLGIYAAFREAKGIFVLPSLQESYGLVLVEALCFSLPIISTRLTPGSGEFINANGSGVLVAPKDSHAIACGVRQIQSDYARYSQNARAHFLAHFLKSSMISSTIELYEKL